MCSLPFPKQFVVSLRSMISFAQWPNCRTWQSAHGIILMFCIYGQVLGCRRASELLGGHEILLSAFYREQIGNDFPCHREGGAVSITPLHLFFVDQS